MTIEVKKAYSAVKLTADTVKDEVLLQKLEQVDKFGLWEDVLIFLQSKLEHI
jgi:hypothetical protein